MTGIEATEAAWHLQERPVWALTGPFNGHQPTGDHVVIVDAAADTGSRYLVLVTPTPGSITGGDVVVAVLEPWNAVYATTRAPLHPSYVAERWGGGQERSSRDIVALTMTINHALECVS